MLNTVVDEASHSKIIKLLCTLHKLSGQIADGDIINAHALQETAFIDNGLAVRLTSQLVEPMFVTRLVILRLVREKCSHCYLKLMFA